MSEENVIKFQPRKSRSFNESQEDFTTEVFDGLSTPEKMILMATQMDKMHQQAQPSDQFDEIMLIHNLKQDVTYTKKEFAEFLTKILHRWGPIAVEVLGKPSNEVSVAAQINVPPVGRDTPSDILQLLNALTIPMFRSVTAFSFGKPEDYHHFFVKTKHETCTLTQVTNVTVTNIGDLL